jgi:hypothetical protein
MSPPLHPPFHVSNFNTKFDGKIVGTEKCSYICSGIRNQKTIIMCTITQETIRKACERTIANGKKNTACHSRKSSDIDLSVKFKGGEYHGRITMDEMRKAYGHAWEKTLSR